MAAVDPWKQVETVIVPRFEGSNQNYLTVKVNGREYIVPLGEEVELPWPVGEAVRNMLDELEGVKKERPASGGGNGVLVVNAYGDRDGYYADKTYEEILAAIQAGKFAVVYEPYEENIYAYPFLAKDMDGIKFAATDQGLSSFWGWLFRPDGSIECTDFANSGDTGGGGDM